MDGDTQVCIPTANPQTSESGVKRLPVEEKSSGDDHVINNNHWLNAEANSWIQKDFVVKSTDENSSEIEHVLDQEENSDENDVYFMRKSTSALVLPECTFRRCQPQCHSTRSVFPSSSSVTTTSSSRSPFRSVSASCVLELTCEQRLKLDENGDSARPDPVGNEEFCLNEEENNDLSAISTDPIPKFRPSLSQREDEDEPDPELPRMATILEKLPWNSIRAREYLMNYLELAEKKGDLYKVSKLKQQIKYLNIRHKKRSYSEDTSQWGNGNNASSTSTGRPKNNNNNNNSETWWRNGMKTNHQSDSNPNHRGTNMVPANWEIRHSVNTGWNHHHPNTPPRNPPVLRTTAVNIPLPPPNWMNPCPYWDPGCPPSWTRPSYSAAWAPIPCPPCPPWVYRRPPLPPPPPMGGGDIFRLRQDVRWPKRMGRF